MRERAKSKPLQQQPDDANPFFSAKITLQTADSGVSAEAESLADDLSLLGRCCGPENALFGANSAPARSEPGANTLTHLEMHQVTVAFSALS
ncbi:MAG: hypothetical protein ACRDCT_16940 [Shewanella sp.]